MPSNGGHPIFYRVSFRTRPNGPKTHMDIEADSASDAEKIALSKGVDSIEDTRPLTRPTISDVRVYEQGGKWHVTVRRSNGSSSSRDFDTESAAREFADRQRERES